MTMVKILYVKFADIRKLEGITDREEIKISDRNYQLGDFWD